MLVSQFQTISSHWFANITADFILPSHFYDHLHYPSAPTEFVLNPLTVKPLQHAIKINRDQQRPWIPHCRIVYTGPRMIFLIVQWNPVNTVTNGSKKFGRVKTINGWQYYQGRLKFHDLRAVMTNTPYIKFTLLEQLFCRIINQNK